MYILFNRYICDIMSIVLLVFFPLLFLWRTACNRIEVLRRIIVLRQVNHAPPPMLSSLRFDVKVCPPKFDSPVAARLVKCRRRLGL